MGFDAVEFILAVESRFGVKLADSEISRLTTVADLAALIARSTFRQETGACHTSRTFYSLRTGLRPWTDPLGVRYFRRGRVEPTTCLAECLPRGAVRRDAWRSLKARFPSLPPLELPRQVDGICLLATAVAVMASPVLLAFFPVLTIASITVVASVLVYLLTRIRVEFPQGIRTVGDLARVLTPIEFDGRSPVNTIGGARLLHDHQVLKEVQSLVANTWGLPLEEIRPETSWTSINA